VSLQHLVESDVDESTIAESTIVESDLVSVVSCPQEAKATIVNNVRIVFFIMFFSIIIIINLTKCVKYMSEI